MMQFGNKVLIIGYGSVSQCTLPILLKHIEIPCKNITILDFDDKQKSLDPWIKKGIKYFRDRNFLRGTVGFRKRNCKFTAEPAGLE